MTTKFLQPYLDGIDVDDMWFQRDNATFHIQSAAIGSLQQQFPKPTTS